MLPHCVYMSLLQEVYVTNIHPQQHIVRSICQTLSHTLPSISFFPTQFNNSHTAADCELRWRGHTHPGLNKVNCLSLPPFFHLPSFPPYYTSLRPHSSPSLPPSLPLLPSSLPLLYSTCQHYLPQLTFLKK